MKTKFKAIFDRSSGLFNFSEDVLMEELLQIAASSEFRKSTHESAREIIEDSTGGVWFSGYDLCDPEFHK